MKYLLSLAFLTSIACSCPTNESGVAVSPTKYAVERDAACAAVDGCDLELLRAVPVFETDDANRDCPGDERVYGCHCWGYGCQSIILGPAEQHETALHEWVHAALASTDYDSETHDETFQRALAAARQWLKVK